MNLSYKDAILNNHYWTTEEEDTFQKRNRYYEYEDENYTLFFPRSIKAFIIEARGQRNCLMEYLEAYVENITDILLVGPKTNPSMPYVTVEIYEN